MSLKTILFISTNTTWGGSEILWTQSAKYFLSKGFSVKAVIGYNYSLIKSFIPLRDDCLILQERYKFPKPIFKLLQKAGMGKYPPTDLLHCFIKKNNPDLIILSQGNNIDGLVYMEDCTKLNFPFVTITQLVTEAHWPYIDDERIYQLNKMYDQASVNYFVSAQTLNQHQKLTGTVLKNAEIVYNPFTKMLSGDLKFPEIKDNLYKIALVGRIELFHKGYDLLVDVLKMNKWKDRPLHFSLFGNGPHSELLKRLIIQAGIENFSVNEHLEDVQTIWETHHLLLMPSRMEGQSLSLIEAMHFQRAAIATDVGGTTEILEEGINGFIVDAPTVDSLDRALEKAWSQRENWEQMGKNAGLLIAKKHPADAIKYFSSKIEEILSVR